MVCRLLGVGLAVVAVGVGVAPAQNAAPVPDPGRTASQAPTLGEIRVWTVSYRSHTGASSRAYVALPAWYGPHDNPEVPLVISPHGRGVAARANLRLFGALPAQGSFAVVSPEGSGRRLARFSWGAPGQVDDLARMPRILRRSLPWLRIDRTRVFALGGSMGGQETLLLLARHQRLLAGVAAFDAVTDLGLQYRNFPSVPCGKACRKRWKTTIGQGLQALARLEMGGSPVEMPQAYAARSPLTHARLIAGACVPIQLWWSTKDRIVPDQRRQSGALLRAIRKVNPHAPVQAFVGAWRHSVEFRANRRLPGALAAFGLLSSTPSATLGLRVAPLPVHTCSPGRADGTVRHYAAGLSSDKAPR